MARPSSTCSSKEGMGGATVSDLNLRGTCFSTVEMGTCSSLKGMGSCTYAPSGESSGEPKGLGLMFGPSLWRVTSLASDIANSPGLPWA